MEEEPRENLDDIELLPSEWDSDSAEEDDVYPEVPKVTVPVNFVSRNEWGAKDGGQQNFFKYPPDDIIFSYTETEKCTTKDECIASMRSMQANHIEEGLPDIRFNFVIGGDGLVYEGTGWRVKAPHNRHYPNLAGRNIEIAHSGKRGDFPTKQNVDLINSLFDYGIENKQLSGEARTYIDYLWPTI